MLETGVAKYITVKTEISWKIPVDIKGAVLSCCAYCWYYSSSANRCSITHDYCVSPAKYVNGSCPFLKDMPEVMDVAAAGDGEEVPFTVN